jgi:Fe2+ or Zn2+ uptake regulation protein
MDEIKEGSAVTCGICSRETTVKFITDREGRSAYDLNCQHRNTICESCGAMVRDASDDILKVSAHCETCDGPYYTDDDDDDDDE